MKRPEGGKATRRVAVFAIVALLFLVVVPGATASTQRDTWDTSYQMSDCGFPVDVHDYGSDNNFRVSADGWTWAKQWEGRRDYTNPANQATASMVWNWMTTQSVAAQTETTVELAITTHGSIRLVAPSGRVVAFDAGQ